MVKARPRIADLNEAPLTPDSLSARATQQVAVRQIAVGTSMACQSPIVRPSAYSCRFPKRLFEHVRWESYLYVFQTDDVARLSYMAWQE